MDWILEFGFPLLGTRAARSAEHFLLQRGDGIGASRDVASAAQRLLSGAAVRAGAVRFLACLLRYSLGSLLSSINRFYVCRTWCFCSHRLTLIFSEVRRTFVSIKGNRGGGVGQVDMF